MILRGKNSIGECVRNVAFRGEKNKIKILFILAQSASNYLCDTPVSILCRHTVNSFKCTNETEEQNQKYCNNIRSTFM